MRNLRPWLVGAALLVPAGEAAAQAPATQTPATQTPSGLILGRVVDAATDKPIARAVVTLGSGAGQPRLAPGGDPSPRVLTDGEGHFLFRDLAKGAYALDATAPGYLNGSYGQRRPEGARQPFVLEDGQRVGDIVLRLWKEGVIGGTVTDDTGAPVIGVTVLINRRVTVNGRQELRTHQYGKRTNDRGAYLHGSLAPGEYVVAVPSGMTVTRSTQPPPDVAAAASLRASGSEALATGVTARASGARVGDFIVLPGGLNALTSDLPIATRADGRTTVHATTFHPAGATLAEAGVVKLGIGDERTDVDIALRPVATVSVSGTALTPSGPAANHAIHLIPSFAAHTPVERDFETAVTIADRTGAFVFPAVPPGSYVVQTWKKPTRNSSLTEALPKEPALWAEATLVVGTTPATVDLTLRQGAALSGQIVLEGSAAPPRPQQFQAVLGSWLQPPRPLAFNAGPIAETRIAPSWEFTKEGMPPGSYLLTVASNFQPPPGWFLKSVVHEGRDLLTSPLVLDGQDVSGIVFTFTDRPAAIAGVVADASGKPDAAAGVLVFPADHQRWLRSGRPVAVSRAVAVAQTGTYSIPDLPPGDYLIVATGIDVLDDWQGAAIDGLAGQATRVTLTNGSTARVDLRRRP